MVFQKGETRRALPKPVFGLASLYGSCRTTSPPTTDTKLPDRPGGAGRAYRGTNDCRVAAPGWVTAHMDQLSDIYRNASPATLVRGEDRVDDFVTEDGRC
jgi:hypothetical protein